MLVGITLALAIGALIFHAAAYFAAKRHMSKSGRRAPASSLNGRLPAVTLLKPLKGLEENLRENLISFFTQQYPGEWEIVFCATEHDDAGLMLAREVALEYPQVASHFVISNPNYGMNPKVANLSGALAKASHDLLFQTDANVRVEPDSVARFVREMMENRAQLVSGVVIGRDENSFGAALENLQMTGYIAPAVCLALEFDVHCVCGKAMLFRRSDLDEVGGLASVRHILCEDYVLGERFKAFGKKVLLTNITVSNINRHCGFRQFFSRHSRWLKMRAVLHQGGFLADLLANPLPFALAAFLLSGGRVWIAALGVAIVVSKALIESASTQIFRPTFAWRYWPMMLVRDAALVPMWFYAMFSRSVTWRGTKLKFGKYTRLEPVDTVGQSQQIAVDSRR